MDSWICTSRQRIRVDLKVCKKARMILKMWKNIWIANTKQNNKFRTAWNDYKKVFFPVGWGKTSQRGGKTSQEGAKSQGGAKRLRGGQSLRGGQGNYPRGGQCPPLRGSGGGIAPFAPPLKPPLFLMTRTMRTSVSKRGPAISAVWSTSSEYS